VRSHVVHSRRMLWGSHDPPSHDRGSITARVIRAIASAAGALPARNALRAGAVVRRAGEADRAGPSSNATTTLNSVFDPSHVTWVSHSGETNTLLSGHHFSALTTK